MIRIAYLAHKFPGLTLTFVYREIYALRQAGLEVLPYSIWRPAPSEVSPEARPLYRETRYLFPLSAGRLVAGHLRYWRRSPQAYGRALFDLLTSAGESLSNRRRTLIHFLGGVVLTHYLEEAGIEHVHAHFALNGATMALIASRLLGIPFSFTAHANDLYANPVLLPMKIREAAFIVAISEYNRRHMVNVVGDPDIASKVHVVHCGLDPAQFPYAPPEERSERPIILGVGRLVEKKGFTYLIAACRHLVQAGYDFEVRIIGDGPLRASLAQAIQAAGLGGRVRLLGALPQEKVREHLRQATIFALPCVIARDGDRDGIPVALMEAMATGLPVVSTTVSGIPELVIHGESGLLVSPGDSQALARALGRLLGDPFLRRRLGEKGREVVLRDFNIARLAAHLVGIFAAHHRLPTKVQEQIGFITAGESA